MKSTKSQVTANYLRECFREENGRLFWIARPVHHFRSPATARHWNATYPGKEAGAARRGKGGARWSVSLKGGRLYRSVIVWALHNGEMPQLLIDHKNRDSLDDRLENLRAATIRQNSANASHKNRSGLKGAGWCTRKQRWVASIRIGTKQIHLGYFRTPEDAHEVYMIAAREQYGEFACSGK
jgi:hypothetical protein